MCVEFRENILLRGEECKPGKIRNFQKWQNDNKNNKLPEWYKEA